MRLVLLLLLDFVLVEVRLVVLQLHQLRLFLHATGQLLLGDRHGDVLLGRIAAGVVAHRRVHAGLIAAPFDLFLVGEPFRPRCDLILKHALLMEDVPLTRLLEPVVDFFVLLLLVILLLSVELLLVIVVVLHDLRG